MDKKVAILQSSYIPWKGYFDIINMVDEFILYDDVQYTKNDWRNRNNIKTQKGTQWITIPVHQKNLSQKIFETKTANNLWRKKHWKNISQWYSKADFFMSYKEIFKNLYLGGDEEFLSKINHMFITSINNILGINTRISWSSDYRLVGDKTERLAELCRQAGATEYISGPSAKEYMNERLFQENGIKLTYMDYTGYPEYNQLFAPFKHEVSIIDLILNEGPNAKNFMKSFKQEALTH